MITFPTLQCQQCILNISLFVQTSGVRGEGFAHVSPENITSQEEKQVNLVANEFVERFVCLLRVF